MTTKKVIVRDVDYGWRLKYLTPSQYRWYRTTLIYERIYGKDWMDLDFDSSYEI